MAAAYNHRSSLVDSNNTEITFFKKNPGAWLDVVHTLVYQSTFRPKMLKGLKPTFAVGRTLLTNSLSMTRTYVVEHLFATCVFGQTSRFDHHLYISHRRMLRPFRVQFHRVPYGNNSKGTTMVIGPWAPLYDQNRLSLRVAILDIVLWIPVLFRANLRVQAHVERMTNHANERTRRISWMLRIVESVKPKDLQVRLLTMPSPRRRVVGGEPGDPAEDTLCSFFTMNLRRKSNIRHQRVT